MSKYFCTTKLEINGTNIADAGEVVEITDAKPAAGECEEDVAGYCNITTADGAVYEATWNDIPDYPEIHDNFTEEMEKSSAFADNYENIPVKFSFVNCEGAEIQITGSVQELLGYWNGDCEELPSNDAPIYGLSMEFPDNVVSFGGAFVLMDVMDAFSKLVA